jgi:hypothetical protein
MLTRSACAKLPPRGTRAIASDTCTRAGKDGRSMRLYYAPGTISLMPHVIADATRRPARHHHFIEEGLVAGVEGNRVTSANADVAVTLEEEK